MRRISLAFLLPLFGLLFWSVQASALITPLRTDGERFYLHKAENWQLAVVRIDMSPRFDIMEPDTIRHSWTVDAEIWLRNTSAEAQSMLMGIVDNPEFTGDTELYLDGQRVESVRTALEYEQGRPDTARESVRRFSVNVPSAGRVVIGVRMRVDAVRDDQGQYLVELPTHMFSQVADKVLQSFIRIDMDARPVGLTSTLSGYTFYDFPQNRISWFALDWAPRIALRVAWLESWTLLTKMAAVEKCPQPWDVVRHVSASNLEAARALLTPFDAQTLRFCATLPLVIHGYVFPSQRVREQFASIPLRRYLGTTAERGSVYRENPSFDRSDLPPLEKIYYSTLTTLVEDAR